MPGHLDCAGANVSRDDQIMELGFGTGVLKNRALSMVILLVGHRELRSIRKTVRLHLGQTVFGAALN
jgi:hypothetical protein